MNSFTKYLKKKKKGLFIIQEIENEWISFLEMEEHIDDIKNRLDIILKKRLANECAGEYSLDAYPFDYIHPIFHTWLSIKRKQYITHPSSSNHDTSGEKFNTFSSEQEQNGPKQGPEENEAEDTPISPKTFSIYDNIYNSVFKKASLLSHPDKIKDKSKEEQEELLFLFEQCQKAIGEDDILSFLLCCVTIGVNKEYIEQKIQPEQKSKILQKLSDIQQKKTDFKQSVAWKWEIANETEKKKIENFIYGKLNQK